MAERRRQVLCFNCDDKFVHGHRCTCLFFIEYEDSPLEDMITDDPPKDDEPRISLYAIAGVQAADTVCLRVRIRDQEFLALIDSGSSHNFIHADVVHYLDIPLTPVRETLMSLSPMVTASLARDSVRTSTSWWAPSHSRCPVFRSCSAGTTSSSTRCGFPRWGLSFGTSPG
jgi:hypothetical protein